MSLPPSKRVKGPRKPVRGLGYLPAKVATRKPMRATRKDVRPGNRAMTPAESARVESAKTTACIPCLVWARMGRMPMDDVANCSGYDHKKSGNIRRGHAFGFASCDWHHQRLLPDGWTFSKMTEVYGPSLLDGSRRFAEVYGTDDELIALQTDVLAGRWSE